MKKLIFQTALIFSLILTYGISNGQANIENCPQKGKKDCPLIKNCSKKGTADCPYTKANNETASVDNLTASTELANCPLAGTADCPYITTAEATASVSENELPACCKKKKKNKK